MADTTYFPRRLILAGALISGMLLALAVHMLGSALRARSRRPVAIRYTGIHADGSSYCMVADCHRRLLGGLFHTATHGAQRRIGAKFRSGCGKFLIDGRRTGAGGRRPGWPR